MTNSNKSALDIIAQRIKSQEIAPTHLANVKHPQPDFFIADIFTTVTFRTDLTSMEYPLFALKAGDTRSRIYKHDGLTISIDPNRHGIATIHDKDIWIYCVSKICQALHEGKPVSSNVQFTIYDYLKSTNRHLGGIDYARTKSALERLKGTSIRIESDNPSERIAQGFSLINDWKVVEEKDGRMVRVEVEIPKWLFSSVTSNKVLAISPDYFRLRKPLDRRIYELVRKHCGHQLNWKISLELLHKKCGSSSAIRNFKVDIKSLALSNDLPDYSITFDEITNMVSFKNRDTKRWRKKMKP